MTDEKKIVEVKVVTGTGEEVPIGLMNVRQAMKLPEELDVTVSHPENQTVWTEAANEEAGLESSPRSGAAADFCSDFGLQDPEVRLHPALFQSAGQV